jgi:hypothetical protein
MVLEIADGNQLIYESQYIAPNQYIEKINLAKNWSPANIPSLHTSTPSIPKPWIWSVRSNADHRRCKINDFLIITEAAGGILIPPAASLHLTKRKTPGKHTARLLPATLLLCGKFISLCHTAADPIRLLERRDAALVFTCNIERGAVGRRCNRMRQPCGNRRAAHKILQLDCNLPLVVIHRDHPVIVFPERAPNSVSAGNGPSNGIPSRSARLIAGFMIRISSSPQVPFSPP